MSEAKGTGRDLRSLAQDWLAKNGLMCHGWMLADLTKLLESVAPSPAPPAEAQRAIRDKVFTVEHKRDGVWRLHIGMHFSTVRSAIEKLAFTEIRKDFPDAELRVAEYIPFEEAHKPAPSPSAPAPTDILDRAAIKAGLSHAHSGKRLTAELVSEIVDFALGTVADPAPHFDPGKVVQDNVCRCDECINDARAVGLVPKDETNDQVRERLAAPQSAAPHPEVLREFIESGRKAREYVASKAAEAQSAPEPPVNRIELGKPFHDLMKAIGYKSQHMVKDDYFMAWSENKAEHNQFGVITVSLRAVQALWKYQHNLRPADTAKLAEKLAAIPDDRPIGSNNPTYELGIELGTRLTNAYWRECIRAILVEAEGVK